MGDVADCAAIELNIQNITGVTDADDDFIRSAQKFVVSSVPSNLLLWAITETVPGTHGGNNSSQQITLPVKSDSLLFVRRDQFEAQKVDGSMRGFIGNSNSLHLATNTFPKYYIADGNRVIVKPDPDNTYTAHAQYVDFSKINDDSDLRSAVVYKAASSEFQKLASAQTSDINTALTALNAAVNQAEAAANKFESATESVFGDEDTFDTAASQLTRVKDALNNAENLIDNDKPAASYDAYDLLQDEDTELLQSNLAIAGTEIQRAQAHLSEWTSIGDMRVKEVDVAIKEANGYANEVQTRINNKTIYIQSSEKYYQWAQMEVQQYVQNNEKTFVKGVAAQSASQQQQASR